MSRDYASEAYLDALREVTTRHSDSLPFLADVVFMESMSGVRSENWALSLRPRFFRLLPEFREFAQTESSVLGFEVSREQFEAFLVEISGLLTAPSSSVARFCALLETSQYEEVSGNRNEACVNDLLSASLRVLLFGVEAGVVEELEVFDPESLVWKQFDRLKTGELLGRFGAMSQWLVWIRGLLLGPCGPKVASDNDLMQDILYETNRFLTSCIGPGDARTIGDWLKEFSFSADADARGAHVILSAGWHSPLSELIARVWYPQEMGRADPRSTWRAALRLERGKLIASLLEEATWGYPSRHRLLLDETFGRLLHPERYSDG